MSTSTLKQLPKGTVELDIIIPWSDIKVTSDKILLETVKAAEIPGFRKGKAPKKLVEGKIDKTKLYELVVKEIVPQAYTQAVKTHDLKPITSPNVEVIEAKETNDWKLKVTVALKPKIDLKNYKEGIKELNKSKKAKIWLPGQKTDEKAESKKPTLDELINTLVESVDVELSDLLIDQEANKLLADLLDETQKLGMTVEQYLAAKGKTSEQLRGEFAQQARINLTTEFALLEIADKENITVTPQDIDKLLEKVEKAEEKEKLKSQSYYLAHLIRQQKTIDFLYNL